MLFHSLSLLPAPFTASTNNFQLIYANCKTAKQNVNLSNIRRSSRKKMIIICIVNKWILACVIHIINKCENKLFACFVCQFPSASHTQRFKHIRIHIHVHAALSCQTTVDLPYLESLLLCVSVSSWQSATKCKTKSTKNCIININFV